jgi:hypothetical protein
MHLLKPPSALFTPAILWKVVTSRPSRAYARRAVGQTRVAHHSH